MKLIQCRFSSGQRVPLLVQADNAAPLPILVPFIYVQLKLRHRAYNTAAAHLRAIQAFYSYAKSRVEGRHLGRGDRRPPRSSAIAQNCLLKGLDVENILTPLRKR